MRSLAPIRFGLRGARRRLGLVALVHLVSLLPALLVALLALGDLSDGLAHSLFAQEALSGNRWGVWQELTATDDANLAEASGAFSVLAAVGLLVQVLVAAGIAEVLLFREPRGEHPFLLGIGRHGWKFVRSALWFGIGLTLLAAAVAAGFGLVYERAAEAADGGLQLRGWVVVLAFAVLAFVPLDLAYDLSRVAAAGHGDRRTLAGFFRALGHALRHPLRLAPLWLFFHLLAVGLVVGATLGRAAVAPRAGWHFLLLFLVAQLVFFLLAFLKVGLWGAEIAYYQAIGEPRWCGRREARSGRRERRHHRVGREERDERDEENDHEIVLEPEAGGTGTAPL